MHPISTDGLSSPEARRTTLLTKSERVSPAVVAPSEMRSRSSVVTHAAAQTVRSDSTSSAPMTLPTLDSDLEVGVDNARPRGRAFFVSRLEPGDASLRCLEASRPVPRGAGPSEKTATAVFEVVGFTGRFLSAERERRRTVKATTILAHLGKISLV